MFVLIIWTKFRQMTVLVSFLYLTFLKIFHYKWRSGWFFNVLIHIFIQDQLSILVFKMCMGKKNICTVSICKEFPCSSENLCVSSGKKYRNLKDNKECWINVIHIKLMCHNFYNLSILKAHTYVIVSSVQKSDHGFAESFGFHKPETQDSPTLHAHLRAQLGNTLFLNFRSMLEFIFEWLCDWGSWLLMGWWPEAQNSETSVVTLSFTFLLLKPFTSLRHQGGLSYHKETLLLLLELYPDYVRTTQDNFLCELQNIY